MTARVRPQRTSPSWVSLWAARNAWSCSGSSGQIASTSAGIASSAKGSARTSASETFSAVTEMFWRLPVATNSSRTSHWSATSTIAIVGHSVAKRLQAGPCPP